MKNTQSQTSNAGKQNTKPNTKFNNNKHRPENKDDLDSREGEEQQFKGDDVTHNSKETKSEKKHSKKA